MPDMISRLFDREAGYVFRSDDAGGPTNLGITQGTLSLWLRRPASIADVKGLTKAQARQIYQKQFIDLLGLDKIQDPVLQEQVFDSTVNFRAANAIGQLQLAVDVPDDGHLGPKTLAAINNAVPLDTTFLFSSYKFDAYAHEAPNSPTNTAGLMNRCATMLEIYADEARKGDGADFARKLAAKLREYAQSRSIRTKGRLWFTECANMCRAFVREQQKARDKRGTAGPRSAAGRTAPARPLSGEGWDKVEGWRGRCTLNHEYIEDVPESGAYGHNLITTIFDIDLKRIAAFDWRGKITMSRQGSGHEGVHGELGSRLN